MKSKQATLDSLHAQLRTTSAALADSRRTLEDLQNAVQAQQIARQKVANLSQAREDEQHRLLQEQSRSSQPNPSSSWETELSAMLSAADSQNQLEDGPVQTMLPSTAVLKARIKAVKDRRDMTQKLVQALKGKSRDVEIKYRRVVALCTDAREDEVDTVMDNLLKAIESERDELDIGRVRRFLSGVGGIVR